MLACVLMVGGCALGAKPAPATFDLAAPRSVPGSGSTSIQFAVTEPTVVGALNSERIVVRPAPAAITYLSGAQWSDRAPKLVQARLIDTFRNSGRVRSVGMPGGAVVNDIGLVTDLQDFHIDAQQGIAVVTIAVRIVSDQSGRVIASRTFTASTPISGSRAEDMVAALNASFDKVATDLVVWTLDRI